MSVQTHDIEFESRRAIAKSLGLLRRWFRNSSEAEPSESVPKSLSDWPSSFNNLCVLRLVTAVTEDLEVATLFGNFVSQRILPRLDLLARLVSYASGQS